MKAHLAHSIIGKICVVNVIVQPMRVKPTSIIYLIHLHFSRAISALMAAPIITLAWLNFRRLHLHREFPHQKSLKARIFIFLLQASSQKPAPTAPPPFNPLRAADHLPRLPGCRPPPSLSLQAPSIQTIAERGSRTSNRLDRRACRSLARQAERVDEAGERGLFNF